MPTHFPEVICLRFDTGCFFFHKLWICFNETKWQNVQINLTKFPGDTKKERKHGLKLVVLKLDSLGKKNCEGEKFQKNEVTRSFIWEGADGETQKAAEGIVR